MKVRSGWVSFGFFVLVVLGALGLLLYRGGAHGQSATLAIALLFVLALRIGIFAWNLRRQQEQLKRKL